MTSYDQSLGAPAGLAPDASPQQLRDLLAAQPHRALEISVHRNADEALRQWLWESGDDELRLGMYRHYLHQREQLLGSWQPLPAQAIQFDAAVAQAQLLLESGRMPVAQAPLDTSWQAEQTARDDHTATPGQNLRGQNLPGQAESAAPSGAAASAEAVRPMALRLSDGTTVPLVAARVLLGRSPVPGAYPDAQLVAIPDPTRQLSSTHALLEYRTTGWQITDLHSTNGTALGEGARAQIAAPGVAYLAPAHFVIGRQPVDFVMA